MKAFAVALLLASLAISATAAGTNRIDGAFGVTLGDSFEPSDAPATTTTVDEAMYPFTPKNPHDSFNQYYVLITPVSHRVYCIWAIGPEMNVEKAKIHEEVVFKALTKKYGTGEKQGIFDGLNDAKRIDKGDRGIYVNVRGFSDGQLNLRYTDSVLEKKAKDEEIEVEAKKKDNSGL